MVKSEQFRPEVYVYNFLTATPSGATETGNIILPPGAYFIGITGTHTDGGTDPTLLLELYANEAHSAVLTIPSAQIIDTAVASGAETIVNAAQFHIQYYTAPLTVANSAPLVVPFGLKWTWTKNQSTSPNVTLTAVRVA